MTSAPSNPGGQKLNPQPILDMNYAFARTAMMVAAVRLHIFNYLASRALTPAELAVHADIVPAVTERLLRGLELIGLVEKDGSAYRLTPIADQFLVEGKSSYLGGDTLAMLDYVPAWFELDQTMRTHIPYRDLGDAPTAERFFAPRVRDLFPLVYPIATRTVAELALNEPHDHALHVLDVGAGSAPWSVAFAQRYPSAHVTAIDLPDVVEQGRQQVAELGLENRYTWISQDMEKMAYTDVQSDVIVVAHVLRFISDGNAKMLLKKLVQSLRPGGTFIVADVFFSDERSGPPPAITLDLSMLVNTEHGRIRTCGEVASWLQEYGLRNPQRFHVAGPFPIVFAQKEE